MKKDIETIFKNKHLVLGTAQIINNYSRCELGKRCVAKTGQVVIQVRDVQGASGGDGQDDNPFDWDVVCKNIEEGLIKDNYKRGVDYEIMLVPNIVNITYGRGVGYAFDEEVFDDATQSISATKIRKKMRDEGKLK